MQETHIQMLENDIKEAQKAVELMEALKRLESNKDFIALIGDELLNTYTINMVHLLSNSNMQDNINQADITKELEMVGRIKNFFNSVVQKGNQAERTIKNANDALIELYTGGN